MKERQFDHIENKIREAAAASEPEFDEQAWQKMERLLDDDNDRRRPLGWFIIPALLCFLLAGYVLVNNHKKDGTNVTAQHNEIATNNTSGVSGTKTVDKDISNKNANNKVNKNDVSLIKDAVRLNKDQQAGNFVSLSSTNHQHSIVAADNNITTDDHSYSNKRNKVFKSRTAVDMIVPAAVQTDDDNTSDNDILISSSNTTLSSEKINNDVVKNDNVISTDKKDISIKDTVAAKKNESKTAAADPKKNKNRVSTRLYFIGLAGAEASSVKFLSMSNSAVVAKYSVGVGYQITPKLSVQTGLSVSHKKYIAGADDYNPKTGSYWAMVQIKKVDANCLVYEIPVNFRYNVFTKNKTSFYAVAGASSFIMKKEDYDYTYIRDNAVHEAKWEYKGNRHLFSNVNIAVGVEQKLSNRVSLLVEPSVSIPMSGVGDGKVKLFSLGVQAGVRFSPFQIKR